MRLLHVSGLLALLALAVSAPCGATEYVVAHRSKDATDDGPGDSAKPFATISRAVRDLKPGDRVTVRSGVYRESVDITASGTAEHPVSIVAETGATVVISGADPVKGLKQEPDGRWSVAWDHRFEGPHPNDPYHHLIGRAEQVMVENYPLGQVELPEQVVPGTFCHDIEGKRLWLRPRGDRDMAEDGRAEASVRPCPLHVVGAYVHVRGLRVCFAANIAQRGMVSFNGDHGVIEDCVFERANACGASFGASDLEVRRCSILDNGQLGFGAFHADRLHLVDCVVRGNNTKDYSRGWEAGGDKCCLSRGVVYERCRFESNHGGGVWFDIGNEDSTVNNCLIADNEGAGIFYEISYGLHAHDNVVVGNGLQGEGGGGWGADGGISLSSSPNCVIERNLFYGNKEGFQYREQGRSTPRLGGKDGDGEEAVWTHDQRVVKNLFAWNRDAQIWGWFDIPDQRCWPLAMWEKGSDTGKAAADIAAGYQAKDEHGQPVGLTLEKLKLHMGGNAYAVHPGQDLFNWGCVWRRNVHYHDLAVVKKELSLEQDSVLLDDLPFADPLARDFRLPANHQALRLGCYPQGEVPGVTLGVLKAKPDAGR